MIRFIRLEGRAYIHDRITINLIKCIQMFTYLVKEKPSGNKRGPGIGKLLGEYKVPIVRRAPGDFQKHIPGIF